MAMDIFRCDLVLYVMMISYLLEHVCYCLGEKQINGSLINHLYYQNITLYKPNITAYVNTTNAAQTSSLNYSLIKTLNYGNLSEHYMTGIENKTESELDHSDGTKLPSTILITSPAVAVGIFIFICIAYKWHTVQLDSQAKELAAQMGSAHFPSPCIPCSPCHNSHRLLPPSDSININSSCLSESDLPGTRRKSLRTPSPILLSPPRLGSHRGSSWSALSDQEVISHSPRRHSTFLL